jgi:outer membrane protein assembly factor BamB
MFMSFAAVRAAGFLMLCALGPLAVDQVRAANVEPLWQLAPAPQGTSPFVHLNTPQVLGAGFGDRAWVYSVASGSSGLRFQANGSAELRRIHTSFPSSTPTRAEVLDVGAGDAVVRVESPNLLWLIDADGRLRWSKQIRASSARVFPGGDVAYVDDESGRLIGLRRGSDGAVLWARAYGDFPPSEEPGDIRRIAIGPNQIFAASSFSFLGNDGFSRFHALDRSTGDTQWVVDTPVNSMRSVRCMQFAGDSLLVLFAVDDGDPSAQRLEIERRSAESGQLLSTIVVPDVQTVGVICEQVRVGNFGVFAVRGDSGPPGTPPPLLLSVGPNGQLAARHITGRVQPGMLIPVPGSHDVLVEDVRPDGTRMLARWAVDGADLKWERAVSTGTANDARVAALRLAPSVVERLAWTREGVSIRQLDLSSGAIVGSRSEAWVSPTSALLLHRMTSSGLLRLEALPADGPRRIRLSRINVDSGAPSQTLEFDTPADLLPAYSSSLLQVNDSTLVLATNHRESSFAQDCRETTRLVALDAATWSLRWQELAPAVLFSPRVLDSVHFSIDSATRSGPPTCQGATTVVRALEAATGQQRWTSPLRLDQTTSTAGELFVAERGTGISRRFARITPETGTPVWTIATPAEFSAGNILATLNGGLYATLARSSSPGLLEVARRDRANGNALWTTSFSDSLWRLEGSVVRGPESGVVMVAGSRNFQNAITLPLVREFVGGIDGVTGEILFDLRPEEWPFASTNNLAPIPSASEPRWLSADTFDSFGWRSQSAPLSALRALGGNREQTRLGGNHLIERQLADGLSQFPKHVPFHAFPDGSVLASTAIELPNGAAATIVSRLPAPSLTATADLRIRPINDGRAISGFGPRKRFDLEIENPSAIDAPSLRLRYVAYTPGGALVTLSGCAVVGTGTCPTDPEALEDWRLGIGPNSTAVLTFELLDRNYRPGIRSFMPSSGDFHLDPPFSIADPVLTNNSAKVIVELFDMSSSFEQ